LNCGRVIASGSQGDIRADLKDWSEELVVRCSDPQRLVRALFDAGLLVGFDLEPDEGGLRIRVQNAEAFYAQWLDLILKSGVTMFEIRGLNRSLKQVYERVTA
jgi:ABC-2 type transport system ATP-binding protein